MSVRVAGPARVLVENLEERRLLSGVGDAVAWDLKTPINGELSVEGEVDYYRFDAQAGEKFVFDSVGPKQFAILDSDGKSELDHLTNLDGDLAEPTPGRLVWEAPHAGTFYVSVSRYTAFLIDVPTGPYSLAAYPVVDSGGPENAPTIAAGQSVARDFKSGGEIDYYSFDAKAGTIYRFAVTSEKLPDDAFVTAHYVMGVEEARPWMPATSMPEDAQEQYPGHNLRYINLDGQKALENFAEWVAPASGTYHFSIAPLDGAHVGPYTLGMSARSFPCDPQSETTAISQNTAPTSSSRSARHRKPTKHHRRPAVHKHAKLALADHSKTVGQKLLSLRRD